MEANDDPYQILGVSNTANDNEIKKSYRKLALQYHPDKQKGSEEEKIKAQSMFAKVCERKSETMKIRKKKCGAMELNFLFYNSFFLFCC